MLDKPFGSEHGSSGFGFSNDHFGNFNPEYDFGGGEDYHNHGGDSHHYYGTTDEGKFSDIFITSTQSPLILQILVNDSSHILKPTPPKPKVRVRAMSEVCG